MMTIEELEFRLAKIKEQHAKVMRVLKCEGVTSFYNTKVVGIVERYEPQMKPRCEDLIKYCGIYTAKNGYSEKTDYIKNFAFAALGKAIGKNLEDW
jgi:hypothetical protein